MQAGQMPHGPHDQHGQHDNEGTPINYADNDICIVIGAAQVEDTTAPPGPRQYSEVLEFLNTAITGLVRADTSLVRLRACDPNPQDIAALPWLLAKDPLGFDETETFGHEVLPWVVFPPVAEVDEEGALTDAVFFYDIGVAEPEDVRAPFRGVPIVQQLVDLINARLVDGDDDPDAEWVIQAAHPNWLQDPSNDHSTGCPGSVPEPAPQGDHKFHFPYHPAIEVARAAEGGDTADVVVFVLDTCPDPAVVHTAATTFTANPLLNTVANGDGVSPPVIIGAYPSLTEAQARYFHVSTLAALPPWHLPGPASPPWDKFEVVDHGLMVAGIVRDVARCAEIRLVRVLGEYGVGRTHHVIDLLRRLPDVVDPTERKVIVNLSLVCSIRPDLPSNQRLLKGLTLAINWLIKRGFLVVSSAGNQGHDSLMPRPLPMYPARLPTAFSVTTVRPDLLPTWLSPLGTSSPSVGNGIATSGGDVLPPPGGSMEHDPFIDMKAYPVISIIGLCSTPGDLPLEKLPGYPAYKNPSLPPGTARTNTTGWIYWSGASFATPIMTGVAAALWRVNPGWKAIPTSPGGAPSNVRQEIQSIGEANRLSNAPGSPKRTKLDDFKNKLLCEVIEAEQT
jgi:hypothetical protein